jgi:hypothetical protein
MLSGRGFLDHFGDHRWTSIQTPHDEGRSTFQRQPEVN